MVLESIIAELRATLESESQSRKRRRYQREEQTVQRVRRDLATGDREQWLQDTLETDAILDPDATPPCGLG